MTVDGKAVVKVGYTTRSVEQRARELGTGLPGGFSIAYQLHVDDARAVERLIHNALLPHRVTRGRGREFFSVPAEEAIEAIESVALQVSSQRVQEVRASELAAFRREIGAERAEKMSIRFAVSCFWVYCAALVMVPEWRFNIGSAAMIVGSIALGVFAMKRLYRILHDRFVERPYGKRIKEQEQIINRKYPMPSIARSAAGGEGQQAKVVRT